MQSVLSETIASRALEIPTTFPHQEVQPPQPIRFSQQHRQWDREQELVPWPGIAYKNPSSSMVASYIPTPTAANPIKAALPRIGLEPEPGTPKALGTLVSGLLDPNSGGRPPVAGTNDFGHTPSASANAPGPTSIA